jgi:mRNA interferase HigB
VRIISKKRLAEFWSMHPDAEEPLMAWYRITKKASWNNLAEARQDFRHADPVGTCTVFNIKGNDYRLVTKIFYLRKRVLIRFVMTHKEYDKGVWKNDCSS